MSRTERFGLSAALTTPFAEDGRVDIALATSHAKTCLAKGCDSVTLFGTTGEGTSISDAERVALFEGFVAGGIPADKIVVGVAETAIDEAIAKVQLALKGGCRAVLLLPPFYFKGVSDDGLFGWFEAVLGGLGTDARDIILYHIPSVAQVGLPVPLVRRITDAFPKAIRGVKDSGGQWSHTEALLAACPDLEILVGDERDLARAVRAGGAGAISGMGNVFPARVRRLAVDGIDDPAINELVEAVLTVPVTPAVKALVAHVSGDPRWSRTRAPLLPTPTADVARMVEIFDRLFSDSLAA